MGCGVGFCWIWYYSFDDETFLKVDILHILDESRVLDFLGVDAAAIFPAQKIPQFLILDELEAVKHSQKLVSGDERTLGPVEVLQLVLNENSLA